MADEERTGSCILQPCPRDPLPGFEPVCGPHRSRLSGQLRDIPILCDELRDPPQADPARDLVSVLLPAAAIAGQSSAPRVKGSREAPVPISLDRVDLLSAARSSTSATADLAYPEQDEDQIGYLSVAWTLNGWCVDWSDIRRESVPEPVPKVQCAWLLDRLEWAFKEHNAIDEFAAEAADLWHTLRRAAGRAEPKPELCIGVPCRWEGCDMRTLWRVPVSVFEQPQYVECSSCRRLMTIKDYDDWARLNSAALCGRRNGEWYCALAKKHDGDCEPYRGEDE